MNESQLSFDLSQLKKDKIVEFLPGIFYVYEMVGDDFKLTHWNTNHEEVTGYTSSELKGKKVFEFFYPEDFEVIREGLSEIMIHGNVKQVYANLRLKNGQTIPYLFEGFKFLSRKKICFMGVGLDVSTYTNTRRELDFVKTELQRKNRELFGFSMQNIELIRLKRVLKERFARLMGVQSLEEIKEEIRKIDLKLDNDDRKQQVWDVFRLRFNEIHPDFFSGLRSRHPSLTSSEMKYLAYLKIELGGFQIAALLNIGKDAIKKKRYRIRKKLGLQSQTTLEEFVDQF